MRKMNFSRILGAGFLALLSLFDFCILSFDFALADSSSANYVLVEDRFTGGGGSASSSNYQAAETSFEAFAQAAMSSTNYAAENTAGIAGAAPIASLNSVSPGTLSRHYSDENAAFTLTAVDPDSDSLQYRAKQDGSTKAGPQSSNSVSWALSSSDLGRHTLQFEVVDPDGTVAKQQTNYVFRRPVK